MNVIFDENRYWIRVHILKMSEKLLNEGGKISDSTSRGDDSKW